MTVERANRILRASLVLLTLLSPLTASGQFQSIELDPTEVGRGAGTVTATMGVRNPTGGELTFYIGGLSQPGNLPFSPIRQPITLGAGETGTGCGSQL